jgi:hypothetical protein
MPDRRPQKNPHQRVSLRKVAERTGLEPATSGVTGQHSNQLNYRSTFFKLRVLRNPLFSPI